MEQPVESTIAALVTEYDLLAERAMQVRGAPLMGPHPKRFTRVTAVETLPARPDGLGAVRALSALSEDPADPRRAWCRVTADFQVGAMALDCFDVQGDLVDSHSGHITFHDLYVAQGDAQALHTGAELIRFRTVAALMMRDGHAEAAAELMEFLSVRPELPQVGFDPRTWKGFPFSLRLTR